MNRTSRLLIVVCCVLTGVVVALAMALGESRAQLANADQRLEELKSREAGRPTAPLPLEARPPAALSQPGAPMSSGAGADATRDSVAASAAQDASLTSGIPSATRNKLRAAQAREDARSLYADFAAEQGLSAADAETLYALVGAQQHESGSEGTLARPMTEEDDARIASALGGSLIQPLRQYRETLPARMEVAQLASQLQSLGRPLSQAQRLEIGRAIARDRADHGSPAFSPDRSPDEMAKEYSRWRESQQQRVDMLVRDLLTPEQIQLREGLREDSAAARP